MGNIFVASNHGVPSHLDHLIMMHRNGYATQLQSWKEAESETKEAELFGVCMCALYQASTCHRKCHGGGHLLESLVGRAYNLCAAAYSLILTGYYDEALSLVRSVIEIYNLVLLSVVNKNAIREWIESDKRTRLKKFGPAKVREMLKSTIVGELDNSDWYSDLCEKYVHPTPNTRPNMHGENVVVGGIYQKDGLNTALTQLATVSSELALPICKYFQYDDLFEQITDLTTPVPN
jgi:hypothetical protein